MAEPQEREYTFTVKGRSRREEPLTVTINSKVVNRVNKKIEVLGSISITKGRLTFSSTSESGLHGDYNMSHDELAAVGTTGPGKIIEGEQMTRGDLWRVIGAMNHQKIGNQENPQFQVAIPASVRVDNAEGTERYLRGELNLIAQRDGRRETATR